MSEELKTKRKPQVKNCRGSAAKITMERNRENVAYIGRRNTHIASSILGADGKYGNPFTLYHAKDRQDVIAKYKEWIMSDTETTNELRSEIKKTLAGKDLYCWCAPQACHGDVILKIAN